HAPCFHSHEVLFGYMRKRSRGFRQMTLKKNLIQYESRSIYKPEAQDIVKKADRFYKWVKSVIEECGRAA
ncbi:MAG: hypothetical protein J7M11_01300, partial [Elusimicrobia bacterium]|nr:hypothetical protein [Elusimicrobiota bacterium]